MPMPEGTYWVAMMGDKPVGGIFPMSGPMFDGVPEHWFAYLAVDDVDTRLKKATDADATVAQAPWDVPSVGRIAIIKHPGGAMVGLMAPANP